MSSQVVYFQDTFSDNHSLEDIHNITEKTSDKKSVSCSPSKLSPKKAALQRPPGRYFSSENRSPLSSTDSLLDGGQVCYCTGDCQNSLTPSLSTPNPGPSAISSCIRKTGQLFLLPKFLFNLLINGTYRFIKFLLVSFLEFLVILLFNLAPGQKPRTKRR